MPPATAGTKCHRLRPAHTRPGSTPGPAPQQTTGRRAHSSVCAVHSSESVLSLRWFREHPREALRFYVNHWALWHVSMQSFFVCTADDLICDLQVRGTRSRDVLCLICSLCPAVASRGRRYQPSPGTTSSPAGGTLTGVLLLHALRRGTTAGQPCSERTPVAQHLLFINPCYELSSM